jgi:hypothetical protein
MHDWRHRNVVSFHRHACVAKVAGVVTDSLLLSSLGSKQLTWLGTSMLTQTQFFLNSMVKSSGLKTTNKASFQVREEHHIQDEDGNEKSVCVGNLRRATN